MPTLRTTIRPAIRTTARLIPGSLGLAPAFNPSSLNPLQRFLDEDPTYYGSVAGFPVFTPEEAYTSIAQPRSGRCWLFDGSDDTATATIAVGTSLTFAAWVKLSSAGNQAIATMNSNGVDLSAVLRYNGSTTITWFPNTNTTTLNITIPNIAGTWAHVAITQVGTTYALYINGSLIETGTTVSVAVGGSAFQVGRYTTIWPLNGSIKDILIDDEAYTAAEVLSLFNTHTVPAGKTPLAFFRCEEESGTTGYNSLSNSNHLTLTNITQSTFHAVDAGVRYSDANERGHTNGIRWASSGGVSTDVTNTWLGNRISGDFTVTCLLVISPSGHTHVGIMTETSAVASNNYLLLECDLNIYNGNVRIWKNGAFTDVVTTTVAGDRFSIARIGSTYSVLKNGVSIHSFTGSTGDVTLVATINASVTSDLVLLDSDEGSTATTANGSSLTISSLIIPRSIASPTQDVAGNALGVTGPVAKLATAEVRCVTGDGVNAYAVSGSNIGITGAANRTVCFRAKLNSTGFQALISWGDQSATGAKFQLNAWSNNGYSLDAHFAGPAFGPGSLVDTNWHWHAVSYDGTTLRWYLDGTLIGSGNVALITVDSPVTLLAKPASLGAGDKSSACISYVRIYSDVKTLAEIQAINSGTDNRTNLVAHWTCQEGPGTANTNRTIYDTVGSNNLTLVNGTVSNIWANYCPFVKSHCVEYGGNVAANGAFVPGRIGSNLDAAGNVKLLLPGEPSQYDLIYPNRWNMPALANVGITSSTAWGKTTSVQATSPADTKFRNTTKGTKNIIVREPLVDPAKTQLQDYVSA